MILLIAGSGGAAFWLGSTEQARFSNGGLEIDPKDLELGELWDDDHFTMTIPVRNIGKAPLEIESFSSSCSCLSIANGALFLYPHQQATIEVTLDLGRALTRTNPGGGPLNVRLAPNIKGSSVQQTGWLIRGRIRKLLGFDPAILDLRLPCVGDGVSILHCQSNQRYPFG
jgi:hypothetical protein